MIMVPVSHRQLWWNMSFSCSIQFQALTDHGNIWSPPLVQYQSARSWRKGKTCEAMCSIDYIRLRHDYDYANWCGQVFWVSSHPFQYRFLWFNQTNKKGPTQNARRGLSFLAKKSGHKRRFFGRTVDQSRQLSSQPSSATKSGIKACKLYFQSKTQANNPNWTHSRPTYYFYLLGFLLPAPSIT